MSKFYLAYGSNLNKEQMENRCPESKFIGITKLRDYKLTYRDNGSGFGVMNIEKSEGSEVPVAIYSISESDEETLDRCEGVRYSVYYKEIVQVKLNGENIDALVYIMKEKGQDYAEPKEEYYKRVYQGYKDCGFDTKYLEQVTKENMKNVKK